MTGYIQPEINAGYIALTVEAFREKWCVYSHCLDPSTEIFYLGFCKLPEVYKHADAYRNSYWRQHVTDQTVIRVTVLATMDNPIDAQTALRQLFNECRPEANVKGYLQSRKTTVTCVEGANKGSTYESITECALRNGISQGALSNHLNGRPGYESVLGNKFMRGYIGQ